MAQTSGGATGEEMVLMGLRAVRRCAVERCGKGDRTRRRGKEGRKEGRSWWRQGRPERRFWRLRRPVRRPLSALSLLLTRSLRRVSAKPPDTTTPAICSPSHASHLRALSPSSATLSHQGSRRHAFPRSRPFCVYPPSRCLFLIWHPADPISIDYWFFTRPSEPMASRFSDHTPGCPDL